MARVIISGDFEDARKKLNSIGITLTTRPHKKGGFVCYANRALRESISRAIALRELPKDDIYLSGKL